MKTDEFVHLTNADHVMLVSVMTSRAEGVDCSDFFIDEVDET